MEIGKGTDPVSGAVRAQVGGQFVELTPDDLRTSLADVVPGSIRDHFVVVNRRRYPVKQALASATGLDPADFTSQHARSVLRRLGLPLGRLSRDARPEEPSGRPGPHVGDSPAGEGRAERLRPFRNRWVALQRERVLVDGDSFGDLLGWLRSHQLKADAVFLVPEEPERLSHGFTG